MRVVHFLLLVGISFWPPHSLLFKLYGLEREYGKYTHNGSVVGVIMDTLRGELSFVLNGVGYETAFDGIPCVLLTYVGDSVEIDPSEAKESLYIFIMCPPTSWQGASECSQSPSRGVLWRERHFTRSR